MIVVPFTIPGEQVRARVRRLREGSYVGVVEEILDPPRAGCSAQVIQGVFSGLKPPRAVYISCNPEALARDAREIARRGYEIASVQPVDLCPHTAHVETVAVLRRRRTVE